MHTHSNVFSGVGGISQYLDPERHQKSPLIELSKNLNPFRDQHVRIFAKVMPFDVKFYPAYNMLQDARDSGNLDGVSTLVEATSGNTGVWLARLARAKFGIQRVVTIVPSDIATGKEERLRLAGATVVTAGGPPFPEGMSGIEQARKMGKSRGWLCLDQYSNPANPAGIRKWLAPQIDEETLGQLTIVSVALGSTGTAIGMHDYFRHKSSNVLIIGGYCADGHAVPGARTMAKLGNIGFDWMTAVDQCIAVETQESYLASLELEQLGISAGPSSGLARMALHKAIKANIAGGTIDLHRNKKREVYAVFICADGGLVYQEKYLTHLTDEQINRKSD